MQVLVDRTKDTIVAAIKGAGEIVNAVTETVSDSLATALKGQGRSARH